MTKEIKKRGRPAGMRAAQLELQRELLEHPDNFKVIQAVYEAALDPEHKNQIAAQKLILDRSMPISKFDKQNDFKRNVEINIRTLRPEREEDEPELIQGETIDNEEYH